MSKQLRRLGAYFYVPILFLIIGYGTIQILGKPVIDFAVSASRLLLLSDKPDFTEKNPTIYTGKSMTSETKTIKASEMKYPLPETRFGEVIVKKVKINIPLYFGDTDQVLSVGAGMSTGSKFPGEPGTSIIGGHNRPTFGDIYYLEVGDTFIIKTNYGTMTYKVIETKIINATDPYMDEVLKQKKKYLAFLYTCSPLDAIGWAEDRAIVIGEQIAGPKIDEYH